MILMESTSYQRFGAIAQLVEHLHGMQGVSGSSPLGSIKIIHLSKGNVSAIEDTSSRKVKYEKPPSPRTKTPSYEE